MNDNILNKRKMIASEITEHSPSLCLAKWLQVTIDLVHGTTHSCHHPQRHKIPLQELRQDPSALHNTAYKKQQRDLMLKGQRPSECNYCWNIEDSSEKNQSDRWIKNSDDWAYPRLNEVLERPFDFNINPSYVEVMLDNKCNFACSYCMADISSSIAQEIKKYGPYKLKRWQHRAHEFGPLHADQSNEYIEAFKEWLPDLAKDLKVFRLTGGEPLLSSHTFDVLEMIQSHGHSELVLAINSNLCVQQSRIQKFFDLANELIANKKIKNIEVYASIDSDGAQAEFIRQGLRTDVFWKNIEYLLKQLPSSRLIIMSTYSSLSAPGFHKLLQRVLDLKRTYKNIILDLSYLKEPEYLRANLLPKEMLEVLKSDLNFMSAHKSHLGDGFDDHEISKFERIYHWVESSHKRGLSTEDQSHLSDFYLFVNEYARRYAHLSFVEIFPELKDFYVSAKKARFETAFESREGES